MKRRTRKEFHDYNDYHDRGMMKWITAYAMEELVKGIKQNKNEALKNNPQLRQMTPQEIDAQLVEAAHTKRPVSIQLSQKDQWGRQTDRVVGTFIGYLPGGKIRLADGWISLRDIRHIQVINEGKWSRVEPFKQPAEHQVSEPEAIWDEDAYAQDNQWLE